MTLKEVADAIGTSRSTIHRWEAGEVVPSAAYALLWAEAIGMGEAA